MLVAAFVEQPDEPFAESIPKDHQRSDKFGRRFLFAPFRIYLMAQVLFGSDSKWGIERPVCGGESFRGSACIHDYSRTCADCGRGRGIGTFWLGPEIGQATVDDPHVVPFYRPDADNRTDRAGADEVARGRLRAFRADRNSFIDPFRNSEQPAFGYHRPRFSAIRETAASFVFAAQSLLDKTGIGLSGLVLNMILPIGAIASTEGAKAVGETGVRMVGPVAAFFMLIGLLIF